LRRGGREWGGYFAGFGKNKKKKRRRKKKKKREKRKKKGAWHRLASRRELKKKQCRCK